MRLHQPSAFYGVNSLNLGNDQIDQTGWNEGLYELASGAEVCAYFDHVMQRIFLPSRRVQYFPMSEHLGDGKIRSLVSGQMSKVAAHKTVDASYMNVKVPSVRGPLYDIDDGVACVALNELPKISRPAAGYVVIGAGKTGMDACLWLLSNGVDPDSITWIMPRDSWMLDRANIQPGEKFANSIVTGTIRQMEAIAESSSVDELFDKVNACGQLLRLSDDVRPSMYRCATVTRAELAQLQRITNIVRKGRVTHISGDTIQLEKGSEPTSAAHLHIDCSADALERRPILPVFDGDHICLQSVRTCQQVFSAAFIAHIEASETDEAIKNQLCTVVPHPNSDIDFLRTTLANTLNAAAWAQKPDLQKWLANARLDGFTPAPGTRQPAGAMPQETMSRFAQVAMPAVGNLQKLLGEIS